MENYFVTRVSLTALTSFQRYQSGLINFSEVTNMEKYFIDRVTRAELTSCQKYEAGLMSTEEFRDVIPVERLKELLKFREGIYGYHMLWSNINLDTFNKYLDFIKRDSKKLKP
jgi:hypothetical protein